MWVEESILRPHPWIAIEGIGPGRYQVHSTPALAELAPSVSTSKDK